MRIKKDIALQFVVLGLLGAFFSWLALGDFTNYPVINAILSVNKFLFLVITGALAIPPIVNLILQMSSKGSTYDDKPYYAVLRGISHLIFSSLTVVIFFIIFAFLYVFLNLYIPILISFILTSIIILSLFCLFWLWLEKRFKLKLFDFFSVIILL